jgi:hypothetical protein
MRRGPLCLAVLLAVAAAAPAQPPPEPEPVKLALRPAPAAVPALRYRLLPDLTDQSPGNAALLYYRAFSPDWWGNIRRPENWEKVEKAVATPLKDLPRQDLRWVLQSTMLPEVDRAARREYLDWEMPEAVRKQGIGLLLPDVQGFRQIATLLAVRARLEMAEGRYDRAVYTLQTGFALARHVSDGPTLIQHLVGSAITSVMMAQLEELIQQPGAPNLYWALTDLPRPFADLRKPLQGEKLMLYGTLPMLRDVETMPLSPEQLEPLLKGLGSGMDAMVGYGPKPAWTNRLAGIAFVLRDYPEAKRALVARGRKPEEVEALPALQVVILHSLHQYQRLQDDLFKCNGLPYSEARPHLEQAEREIKRAKANLEAIPFIEFLPAINKVMFAAVRTDRRLAALRCVEAIRLYAAAHDGKLPASLGDVTEVPTPGDPVTGKAFEYRTSGGRATLYGPPPPGEPPAEHNTVNYELTLQR